MRGHHCVLVVIGTWLVACAPCSEDPLEPNEEDSPADGGEMKFGLNELDLNFHDQHDVDCFTYDIPDPTAANDPRAYIEIKGVDEKVDLSITFACANGEPGNFRCAGETPEEPACAASAKEPDLGFSYDCDEASDEALGDASIVVCVTRPTPDKLCVDYTIRAYLN